MRFGGHVRIVAGTTGDTRPTTGRRTNVRSDRWKGATILLLALVPMVAVACGGSADDAGPGPAALVGSKAPALSGPDLKGNGSIDLASMAGKPTVVIFWLYACPHCREFVPAFQAAWQAAAPDADVVTVGMTYDDPSTIQADPGYDSPEAFVRATGLVLPTIESPMRSQSDAWHLRTMPTVFVLGPDLTVRAAFEGDPTPSAVLDALDACSSCAAPAS
jgi:thiol-disulfide isomerase/thioredoxin